eukprot:PLAT11605.10.p1 GENE.PLAT11605.10~~PLAT11605.10.p1  ORF type:complete len:907 (+),score=479.80 PLAT11605.10:154-2721(+)
MTAALSPSTTTTTTTSDSTTAQASRSAVLAPSAVSTAAHARLGAGQLMLLDLDKDNDGVFDVNDVFPLSGWAARDSDNDGIPDSQDLWPGDLQADCVRSGVPAACGSDLLPLYTLMVVAILAIAASRAGFILLHARISRMGYSIADSTDSRRASMVVVPAGKSLAAGRYGLLTGGTAMNTGESGSALALDGGTSSRMARAERTLRWLQRLSAAAQQGMHLAAACSLFVSVAERLPLDGLPMNQVELLKWADISISAIFLLDLLAALRRAERPGEYLREHWYLLPALICEIPGVATLPTLLQFVKVSRLARFISRIVSDGHFASLMVRRPFLFLAVFMMGFLSVTATFLKIYEQELQPSFASVTNVFWFSMVTVTTVGYGDLAPRHLFSRMLTVALMLVGIGLLSTLSALTVARLVAVPGTERKTEEFRREMEHRWDVLKNGLLHISSPYNPLASNVSSMLARDAVKKQGKLASTADSHRSSWLNVTVEMSHDLSLPVDEVLKGAGGKFRVNHVDSQADMLKRLKREQDETALLELVELGGGRVLTRRAKMLFVLRKYGVHEQPDGVRNFDEFVDELSDILLSPPQRNALFLEKLFAAHAAVQEAAAAGEDVDYRSFDLSDPLDHAEAQLEELLEYYRLDKRLDYYRLVSELMRLVLLNDRVQNGAWAQRHLRYRDEVPRAEPMLERVVPPFAHMATTTVVLSDSSVPALVHRGSSTLSKLKARRKSILHGARPRTPGLASMGKAALAALSDSRRAAAPAGGGAATDILALDGVVERGQAAGAREGKLEEVPLLDGGADAMHRFKQDRSDRRGSAGSGARSGDGDDDDGDDDDGVAPQLQAATCRASSSTQSTLQW